MAAGHHEVDLPGSQHQQQFVIGLDLHHGLHIRKRQTKFPQHLCQHDQLRVGGAADADMAVAALPGKALRGKVLLAQHLLCIGIKGGPHVGELYQLLIADEKLGLQLGFQLPDVVRHRGNGKIQFLGCFCEAELVRYSHEALKLLCIHTSRPFLRAACMARSTGVKDPLIAL